MDLKITDVADLDCIYLSYDEPQKEEFWLQIQNIVPWAKRVDNVKGSDAAHKACADASDTNFFVLIDGDNIPDPEFFNLQIETPNEDSAFRWKARNHINGLMYGNGGMSVWSKGFVKNMRTHEASDGSHETAVEFCFEETYYPMHNCYSTTYPNGSQYHAWRAGFREGVKMCLDRGRKPSLQEFDDNAKKRNLDHLQIWQTIGRDVEHGEEAINGARYGTYKTMLTNWDFTQVQDFDKLAYLHEEYLESTAIGSQIDMETITELLNNRLALNIVELDAEQSAFFKYHYATGHKNLELMTKEIDVIRRIEGW